LEPQSAFSNVSFNVAALVGVEYCQSKSESQILPDKAVVQPTGKTMAF